jgi:hypothetical protein
MGKLLSFLPPWVPFAIVGVLLAVLAGGAFELKRSWQAEATNAQSLKDAQAVIAQKEADAKTSAAQLAILSQRNSQLEALEAPVKLRIANAPVTTGCGPVVRDAADGVQSLLEGHGAGGSPAGPVPSGAVRAH